MTTASQAAARIREALEKTDALSSGHSPMFAHAHAYQAVAKECTPDALRALLAERDELAKDAARLDWLERQSKAYGYEIHEGNAWEIYGAYKSIREAIDYESAASSPPAEGA